MKKIIAILVLLSCMSAVAAEDNVLKIEDVVMNVSETIEVPIEITNATGVAGVQMDIMYDPSVVSITDASKGDFEYIKYNPKFGAGVGRIVAVTMGDELSGNLVVANLVVKTVGDIGESSPLSMQGAILGGKCGDVIAASIDDGSVSIGDNNAPPTFSHPRTKDVVIGGSPEYNSASIKVVVEDTDGTIESVTADLREFGMGEFEPMYKHTTSYQIDFAPPLEMQTGTYTISMTGTDDDGAETDMHVQVAVLINGDANGDEVINSMDAMMVLNYVLFPGTTSISTIAANVYNSELITITVNDAIRILDYVVNPSECVLD